MILDDERFKRFLKKRMQIIGRLDTSRKELEDWLAANEAYGDVTELSYLEGILLVRRRLLTELAELDDQVIDLLIEIRTGPNPE